MFDTKEKTNTNGSNVQVKRKVCVEDEFKQAVVVYREYAELLAEWDDGIAAKQDVESQQSMKLCAQASGKIDSLLSIFRSLPTLQQKLASISQIETTMKVMHDIVAKWADGTYNPVRGRFLKSCFEVTEDDGFFPDYGPEFKQIVKDQKQAGDMDARWTSYRNVVNCAVKAEAKSNFELDRLPSLGQYIQEILWTLCNTT